MSDKVSISPQEAFGGMEAPQTQMPDSSPGAGAPVSAPAGVPAGGSPQSPKWGITQTPPTEPHGTPGHAEGQVPTDEPPPATPAAPPPAAITPEMIQQAVQAGAQAAMRSMPQPAPVPQAPRELTPQEQADFDRTFNVVRITPERYLAITGQVAQTPEQIKALESTLHDTVRQAVAISLYQAQQMNSKALTDYQTQMDSRLAPVFQAHQQARIVQLENDFHAVNPDLKDYSELVKEVALATQAQRMPFKSQDEAFKFVADRVRSLLGKAAPSGSPPAQRQPNRRFNMTPLSGGGNPGSGRPPQPAKNSSTISPQEVFTER